MLCCPVSVLLLLGAIVSVRAEQLGDTVPEGGHHLAVVVDQVVEQYLAGCHLVLATTTQHSLLLQHIISRQLSGVGSIVVEAQGLFNEEEPAQEHLLEGLWGEAGHTCRALILHLTNNTLAFRFFERSELWLWPETRVVILGEGPDMEALLHHPSLKNAKYFLYFAVHLYNHLPPNMKLKKIMIRKGLSEKIKVYRRCLYCNNGYVDVQLLPQWNLTSGQQQRDDLFFGQVKDFKDFMGRKFEVICLAHFPLSNFIRNSDEPGTTLTPLDSLGTRVIESFKVYANFTYEVREPLDGQWGVDLGDGNWTGIVGSLQHQQADFAFDLNLTPTRKHVLDFTIPYTRESLVIFSPKPGLLPQHLAIIRPFTGALWLLLFISFILWSITLWLLQKVWSLSTGGYNMQIGYAFLYGWSALMEEYSFNPLINPTGRVLVGLWLMACLILTNTYRSSLMAHLIVQDKMPEVNSFQDMLDSDGWGWGTNFTNDASMFYYMNHPHSEIQEMYKGMQYASVDELFQRVLKGSFSHIIYKYFGLAIVVAKYTDDRGYTPIHLGRKEYLMFLGIGWGFRRGAPMLHRINTMMQHLVDGGLIDYWLDDIISIHMREARAERKKQNEQGVHVAEIYKVAEGNVSLGFVHLQGAFYLLLVGYGLASLALFAERLAICNN